MRDQKEPALIKKNQLRFKRTSSNKKGPAPVAQNYHGSHRTITNQKEPSKIRKYQLRFKRTTAVQKEAAQIIQNQFRSHRTSSGYTEL